MSIHNQDKTSIHDEPIYGREDAKLFTMAMYYSGEVVFNKNKGLCNLDGKVGYWDWVDPDCFSIIELDEFLVSLKF
ncbi:hypothetical protein LINPERPRIM_LOCUS25759 [Linum perenne]